MNAHRDKRLRLSAPQDKKWHFRSVCVCVCVYDGMHPYVCLRVQSPESQVSCFISPHLVLLSQCLSQALETPQVLTRLVDLQVRVTTSSPSLFQFWGYNCSQPHPVFLDGVWGFERRSSCLCSKCLPPEPPPQPSGSLPKKPILQSAKDRLY